MRILFLIDGGNETVEADWTHLPNNGQVVEFSYNKYDDETEKLIDILTAAFKVTMVVSACRIYDHITDDGHVWAMPPTTKVYLETIENKHGLIQLMRNQVAERAA